MPSTLLVLRQLQNLAHSLRQQRCSGSQVQGTCLQRCQWGPRVRALATSGRAEMTENGRGAFLLFEGVDKSGKSTQCRGLVEFLNSDKVRSQLGWLSGVL